MVDVRRLRYFSTLAEVLHFGRAATRLGIAQPALSQQIKALEGEVGLPLFHRSSRGVTLTEAGSAFRPYAVAVVAAADAARAAAVRLRDTRGRTLTLGVPANLPEHLLPDLLLALHDTAPEMQVRTVVHSSAAQVAALRAEELDAGLVRQDPDAEGLAGRLVHRERVGVALPAGHRLARADAVSAAQLSLLELVIAPPAMMPGFHADLVRALTAAGWRGQPGVP